MPLLALADYPLDIIARRVRVQNWETVKVIPMGQDTSILAENIYVSQECSSACSLTTVY